MDLRLELENGLEEAALAALSNVRATKFFVHLPWNYIEYSPEQQQAADKRHHFVVVRGLNPAEPRYHELD
jgi:hypothetical protein